MVHSSIRPPADKIRKSQRLSLGVSRAISRGLLMDCCRSKVIPANEKKGRPARRPFSIFALDLEWTRGFDEPDCTSNLGGSTVLILTQFEPRATTAFSQILVIIWREFATTTIIRSAGIVQRLTARAALLHQ